MKQYIRVGALSVAVVFVSGFALMTQKNKVLQPVFVTERTAYDTDDPAIWINKKNPEQSLIIGTDKHSKGGLYVFDLKGKIVGEKIPLQRPNNVDVAYGFDLNGKQVDIAVVTERETNMIRVFSLPDMRQLDNGGIPVFLGEDKRAPMGIALYTRPADNAIFAIVSRKTGPFENYLWQYQLKDDGKGNVMGEVARKFGDYSGKKEIESIAVDNELGYVYYSDEEHGVHKYYADPVKGNTELALFGTSDFKEDIEGISIYKTSNSKGYILISNQQTNQFMVYAREGSGNNKNEHKLIKAIDFSLQSSDGSEVTNVNLGPTFPKGMFVAMSEKKVFKIFDWRDIERSIQLK